MSPLLQRVAEAKEKPWMLCLATRPQGMGFVRELEAHGHRALVLAVEEAGNAGWPRSDAAKLVTMPSGMSLEQVRNTVTWLARTHPFESIVALDAESQMQAASLREWMRIGGMGLSSAAILCDRLAAMQAVPAIGVAVPAFAPIFHHNRVREFAQHVPAPWYLLPRFRGQGPQAKTLDDEQQLWQALDELGDGQSSCMLEQPVAGERFFVFSILSHGRITFRRAGYIRVHGPEGDTVTEVGTLTEDTQQARALAGVDQRVLRALRPVRSLVTTSYVLSSSDGRLHFAGIEPSASQWPLTSLVKAAHGIDPWCELAQTEIAALEGRRYRTSVPQQQHAIALYSNSNEHRPRWQALEAEQIVERTAGDHGMGVVLAHSDRGLIANLALRFAQRVIGA